MNPSNATPAPLTPISGGALSEDMKLLFCQWGGTPKGIMADPTFGIVVQIAFALRRVAP